jgi:hypothetical protein
VSNCIVSGNSDGGGISSGAGPSGIATLTITNSTTAGTGQLWRWYPQRQRQRGADGYQQHYQRQLSGLWRRHLQSNSRPTGGSATRP